MENKTTSLEKTFNLIDYKGKYYIIQDKDYEIDPTWEWMDIVIGEITKKQALDKKFIASHKNACNYYGIPCYNGKDAELNKAFK